MYRMIFSMLLVFVITACDATPHSGSAGDAPEPAAITGKTWKWIGTVTPVEKITVTDPERYTVTFNDDGKAKMQFDCNRGGGDFTISEKKLTFGPLISTRMACPEGSQDSVFMRDLQRVDSFFIKGGELYLELNLESGTMHFKPAE